MKGKIYEGYCMFCGRYWSETVFLNLQDSELKCPECGKLFAVKFVGELNDPDKVNCLVKSILDQVCKCCGKSDDELRGGICFDCASKGEIRAARRTCMQHLFTGIKHLFQGKTSRWKVKYDLKWFFERLTRTGDYKKDVGYFDSMKIKWR